MRLLKKIIKKLSYHLSKKGIELFFISKKDPGSVFVTNILGKPLIANDPMSFLGQYRDIVERNEYNFYSENVSPYIIDCGSNIGLSIIQHKKNHPLAKVVGFEADPEIFGLLKKNINSFDIHDVSIEQAAIWIHDGELEFYQNGGSVGNITGNESSKSVKVKSIDLREFLNVQVDLLKIDIEGGETILLNHVKDLLHNVRNIFVEFHSPVGELQTLDSILAILSSAGFRYYIESADVFSDQPFLSRNHLCGFDNLITIWAYR
jgi:FkbM family methyltransferase